MFIEKHGKILETVTFHVFQNLKKLKKIESTQDVVDAIHRRQLMANENKKCFNFKKLNNHSTKTLFFNYPLKKGSRT